MKISFVRFQIFIQGTLDNRKKTSRVIIKLVTMNYQSFTLKERKKTTKKKTKKKTKKQQKQPDRELFHFLGSNIIVVIITVQHC